jgi:hypothetical protein
LVGIGGVRELGADQFFHDLMVSRSYSLIQIELDKQRSMGLPAASFFSLGTWVFQRLSLRQGMWVFWQRTSFLRIRESSGRYLFGYVRGSCGGALFLSGYVGLPEAVTSAMCLDIPVAHFFSPGIWVFQRLSLRLGTWVFWQCASFLQVCGSSGGSLFGRIRGSSAGTLPFSVYMGLPRAVSSAECVGLPAARFSSPGT